MYNLLTGMDLAFKHTIPMVSLPEFVAKAVGMSDHLFPYACTGGVAGRSSKPCISFLMGVRRCVKMQVLWIRLNLMHPPAVPCALLRGGNTAQ